MSLGLLLGLPDMKAICTTMDGNDLIMRGVAGLMGNKTVSVVFVSWRFLEFLQTRQSLHLDGTFKKRPRKPKCIQIYNIVTRYGGVVSMMLLSKSVIFCVI